MKRNRFFVLLVFVFLFPILKAQGKEGIYFEGKDLPLEYGKIKCLVLCLGNNGELAKIAKVIVDGLAFTDQFETELNTTKKMFSRRENLRLFRQGYSYCIFLKKLRLKKGKIKFQVIIKDTSSNETEYSGKFEDETKNYILVGNRVCSNLSKDLIGKEGIFLNKLAFCQQLSSWNKIITLSDYSCKYQKTLTSRNKVNSVPCWHSTLPILFYTCVSKISNKLMALDLIRNKQKVICSFRGINSQPSVSQDGKKVALCIGITGNSEIYLYDQMEAKKRKKRVFRQITKNGGNNVSPCFLSNGDIILCSDFELNSPHIYYFDMKKKSLRRITKGNYNAGPSYCKINNSIVFSKVVDHVFQLFTINLDSISKSISEKQLTFGSGDKHDPNWSECGDYIYFAYRCPNDKGKNYYQIAVLNIASKNTRVLTFDDKPKSFPVLKRLKT